MHAVTLTCSNAGGSCLRKARLLHLPPRPLPAQPFPELHGLERVVDAGGDTSASYLC